MRHHSTSLSLRFLEAGHGPPELASPVMLVKTEVFDHNLPSQLNQLRYNNNPEVVKNKPAEYANGFHTAHNLKI